MKPREQPGTGWLLLFGGVCLALLLLMWWVQRPRTEHSETDLVLTLLALLLLAALLYASAHWRWLHDLYRRALDNRLRACAASRARTTTATTPRPDEKKLQSKLLKKRRKNEARVQLK